MEVMVEQFQAHGISDPSPSSGPSGCSTSAGKWIRISPKKRGRSSSPFYTKKVNSNSSVGIKIVEPSSPIRTPLVAHPLSPLGKGKGKLGCEPSVDDLLHDASGPSGSAMGLLDNKTSSAGPAPTEVLPVPASTASPPLIPIPTSVLSAAEVFSSPVATPGVSGDMELDGSDEFFLELADLDAPVGFTDSTKKRKLEEGEEFFSSFTH